MCGTNNGCALCAGAWRPTGQQGLALGGGGGDTASKKWQRVEIHKFKRGRNETKW